MDDASSSLPGRLDGTPLSEFTLKRRLRRMAATGLMGCFGEHQAFLGRLDQPGEVDGIALRLVLMTIVEQHVQPFDS